jgi:hypothetical protein
LFNNGFIFLSVEDNPPQPLPGGDTALTGYRIKFSASPIIFIRKIKVQTFLTRYARVFYAALQND